MKATALVLAIASGHAAAQPSIVSVGTLPGGAISSARGVSTDGTYVVGDATINGESFPYIWTRQTGITPIPVPNTGSFYNAQYVSHDGRFVSGGFSLDGGLGSSGFVWSQETGVVLLGSLPGGSERSGVAFFGNQTEFALGSSSHAYNQNGASISRAVRWTFTGGFEILPLPAPGDIEFTSSASNVLADGRIFIKANSGSWLWSESAGFEQPFGAEGMFKVNSDGSFMIGTLNNPNTLSAQAAYWTPNTGAVFLPLSGTTQILISQAVDMNDDGSVILGSEFGHPVVWLNQGTPISIEDYASSLGIDMTDWNILNAWGISGDGSTIIGQARHKGLIEGFVLTTSTPQPPCPADTNNDGTLSPADFTAWIAAFNATSDACDQNDDGLCTPADFTAWIANYNAGC